MYNNIRAEMVVTPNSAHSLMWQHPSLLQGVATRDYFSTRMRTHIQCLITRFYTDTDIGSKYTDECVKKY